MTLNITPAIFWRQFSVAQVRWLLCGLCFLLMSCSSSDSLTSAEPSVTDRPVAPEEPAIAVPTPSPQSDLAQTLPVTAEADIKGEVIQLEVATTSQQQALGLMYRPELPADRGMLFQFSSPRPANFWMKNVPVPLDMVFLRQGEVQAIAAEVPPCISEPCPTYGPGRVLIDQVIELRSGRAAELGLEVGDRVTVTPLARE